MQFQSQWQTSEGTYLLQDTFETYFVGKSTRKIGFVSQGYVYPKAPKLFKNCVGRILIGITDEKVTNSSLQTAIKC